MSRASLDKKPQDVASMFDGVAPRYDVANTVLAFGQDWLWRRATRKALELGPADRCLDVAAGTGVSTMELAKSGADVVACDFSLGMLRAGLHREVPMVAADGMRLPFADASFDAVTISFGLRNIVDPDAALAEFARVTKPGGRLVICEFSRPTWAPYRAAYGQYLKYGMPLMTKLVSSNPAAYNYLIESIGDWSTQPELADRIMDAGWRRVAWRDLSGGAVALHRATRP